MALPKKTRAQPIPPRRAVTFVGQLEHLLRPWTGASAAGPARLDGAAEARCSSSSTFSISPGGVYELRLLIYLNEPADHRMYPIAGQLSFRDSEGEQVPAEFDAHAHRAGDLSRFVVEGFDAAFARYDIEDLLVAHRYFIAPPYAREVRLELTASAPFRIPWLECEPLVANWLCEADRVRAYLRKHHRLRLAALSSVLSEKGGPWTRADASELERIAAAELEQISVVTSPWSFAFDWKTAVGDERIDCLADEFYRIVAKHEQQRPALAFIGGERLYNKLLAHFDVVLVPESAPEEMLDSVSVEALVIESVAEDLNGEWRQAWCGVAEGAIAPGAWRLLELAGQLHLPVVFHYTAAPAHISLFRLMFELADHVFVEGSPDAYADARLSGADARMQFVPRSFERLLSRPSRDVSADDYGILLPLGSELLGSSEVRSAIAALPPRATLLTAPADELGGPAGKPTGLRRWFFLYTASYHEVLHLCRRAAVTVLIGETLDRNRQQETALDAIASGSVVVFMGDPDGLDEIGGYVLRVGDTTELSEQIRLLANHEYRRRIWLTAYRGICRDHAFDSVAERLKAVCRRPGLPLLSGRRSEPAAVLAPAGRVQYG